MKKPYGDKVSASLKDYYKTDKYLLEEKVTRYKKISDKRKVRLNPEELEILKTYLEEGYIRNLILLGKRVTSRFSYKAILNEFESNNELKEKYKKSLSALPFHIQSLSLEEWAEVKQLIISCEYLKLKEKYDIGEKSRLRIEKRLPEIKTRKFFNKKETNPERIIREILEELQIQFKREVSVNSNQWIIDFLIEENLALEVHGDYWHVNPRMNYQKINKTQLKNQLNDINKKNWLLDNDYNLLVIWEMDIYQNLESIKTILHEYIKQKHLKRLFIESI